MKKIVLRIVAVLGVTLLMSVAGLYCIMWICVNGPSQRAKELFVLSVRETSAAGFLADIFCTKEEISELEKANKADDNLVTDTTLINVQPVKEQNEAKQKFDLAVSDDTNANRGTDSSGKTGNGGKSSKGSSNSILHEDGIEFHNVSGATYKGIMMVVEDPSRIIIGASSSKYEEDVPGKKVIDMITSYKAVGGVNAGGFEDPNGAGNGGIPIGLVISEGKMLYGEPESRYEVIGFSKDNILVVGAMTAAKALQMGIRDAVSFGPALVVNGKATKASGGGGFNPRTAIGQRADGAVLLLVIDGMQSASLGATYGDITKIMLEFGAVNAANLDGGSSSVMYYKGKLLNTCCSLYGPREMPTCILVKNGGGSQ